MRNKRVRAREGQRADDARVCVFVSAYMTMKNKFSEYIFTSIQQIILIIIMVLIDDQRQ